MGDFVVNGAMLKCDKAVPPGSASLIVLPASRVTSGDQPVANVMDFKPIVNIPLFGMCTADTNPTVIAATAAAQGVKTPGACAPLSFTPWSPGSNKTSVAGMNALTKDSTCNCNWLGKVSIDMEGQKKASVG